MRIIDVGEVFEPIELENVTEEISKLQEYLDLYLPKLVSFGIRLIITLVLFFIGMRIIKLIRKLVHRSMDRAGAETGVIQFLDSVIKVFLYFVLIMFLASGFGVDTASVIALVGSAGLAIGLALQGSLSNFAGGVLILTVKPFKVGDYIIQGDLEGTVAEIEMFYTILLTVDNRRVVIPNGTLANNSLVNVTAEEKRKLDIEVGISYDSDLKKAKDICHSLIDREERVLREEEILVVVSELADSAVVLKLRFWVHTEDYWPVRWAMTESVKLAFDENGIEIPYPQMGITLKEK